MKKRENNTVGSIEPTGKQSRKEYLKNWKYDNPEKIRDYKRIYYSKHSEQERARQRKIYHSNKEKIKQGKEVGKINDKTARIQQLSPTNFFRGKYIVQYGSKEINYKARDNLISIWKAYKIVRNEVIQYEQEVMSELVKHKMDFSKIDTNKIRKKYQNLKQLQ